MKYFRFRGFRGLGFNPSWIKRKVEYALTRYAFLINTRRDAILC